MDQAGFLELDKTRLAKGDTDHYRNTSISYTVHWPNMGLKVYVAKDGAPDGSPWCSGPSRLCAWNAFHCQDMYQGPRFWRLDNWPNRADGHHQPAWQNSYGGLISLLQY